MNTRGPISPLAIALSSVGTGMAQYGRDREERQVREAEIGRLNDAEGYRRKMAKDALERAEAQRLADKAEAQKTRARRVQAVTGIQPTTLNRPLTDKEAAAIVDDDINVGDLVPFRPSTSGNITGNQQVRLIEEEAQGDAFMQDYAVASGVHDTETKRRFWANFERIRRSNPSMSQGRVAYQAHAAMRAATTQANADQTREASESRTAPRQPLTIRNGVPTLTGTGGIPAPVTMTAKPAPPAGGNSAAFDERMARIRASLRDTTNRRP